MPEQKGLGLRGTHLGSHGSLPRDRSGNIKRNIKGEAGRTCAQEGCDTRLSIYNVEDYCSVHAPAVEVEKQERVVRRYRSKGYVF